MAKISAKGCRKVAEARRSGSFQNEPDVTFEDVYVLRSDGVTLRRTIWRENGRARTSGYVTASVKRVKMDMSGLEEWERTMEARGFEMSSFPY